MQATHKTPAQVNIARSVSEETHQKTPREREGVKGGWGFGWLFTSHFRHKPAHVRPPERIPRNVSSSSRKAVVHHPSLALAPRRCGVRRSATTPPTTTAAAAAAVTAVVTHTGAGEGAGNQRTARTPPSGRRPRPESRDARRRAVHARGGGLQPVVAGLAAVTAVTEFTKKWAKWFLVSK